MSKVFGTIGTMLGLIALYLLLANAYGTRTLIKETSAGSVGLIKALQGR